MPPLLGSQEAGEGSIPTAAGLDSPGEGGDAATLAAVYAAGAAAPATADLMAMASGTTARFQANTGGNPLPLIGLYETAASKGAISESGYPAIGQSLAVNLGTLIGGRSFNAYEMFDPNWDGDLNRLDHYSWEIDEIGFNTDPTTAWRLGGSLALRYYEGLKNYRLPSTPPPPDLFNPFTLIHRLRLYNSVDGNRATVEQIDGFGHVDRQLTPVNVGVTYQWLTHWKSDQVSDDAGNGPGWGVVDGNIDQGGDTPQAAVSFRTLTGPTNAEWYFAISARDSLGTGNLVDVATFARQTITFFATVSVAAANVVAPGAQAVTISNSPGASAAPVEYWQIKTAGGTRYIALLA